MVLVNQFFECVRHMIRDFNSGLLREKAGVLWSFGRHNGTIRTGSANIGFRIDADLMWVVAFRA